MSKNANKKYQRLKEGLIQRGTNVVRWAAANGYPVTTVYGAARGLRAGIKAVKIRRALEAFLNE